MFPPPLQKTFDIFLHPPNIHGITIIFNGQVPLQVHWCWPPFQKCLSYYLCQFYNQRNFQLWTMDANVDETSRVFQ